VSSLDRSDRLSGCFGLQSLPRFAVFGVLVALLSGCGSVVSNISSGMADNLSGAILNQDDPELVREALPAYLLMLDSLLQSDPDNVATLSAAAQLYSAYASALIDDPARARVLTTRARDYGSRALCSADSDACNLRQLDYDAYIAAIQSIDDDEVFALYSYSVSSLAWIRAHSDDFGALAELPKIESALQQVMKLNPGELAASTCMYLGILNTLLPEALGGKPELGRKWFEQGIELSQGKDLSIKVEFARGYARLKYDRELHDALLNEVLAAEVKQPNLTLFNILAREQAEGLLTSADDYF
jgi:uncharacterized protein YceK